MKHISLLAAFMLLFSTQSVLAGAFDRCSRNDAVCVGEILLDVIQGGNKPVIAEVRFYTDSTTCKGPFELVQFTVDAKINEDRCEKIPGNKGYYSFLFDRQECRTDFVRAVSKCKELSSQITRR